jgi:hypothetical protein
MAADFAQRIAIDVDTYIDISELPSIAALYGNFVTRADRAGIALLIGQAGRIVAGVDDLSAL